MIPQTDRRVTIPEDIWISLLNYTSTENQKNKIYSLTPSGIAISMVRNALTDLNCYPPPMENNEPKGAQA